MSESNIGIDPFKEIFNDFENLADKISDVLKCPVTIEDANHRLIAYSTHQDHTDPARIATIIGRHVPEKVINSLWKKGIIPALMKSEDPIRINKIDEIGLGNRVAVSIQKNQEVIGYIWVLEVDRSLNEEELLFLKKAAQAAKNYLLQLQNRKHKKEESYQELFWQLLTGHLKSMEDIRKRFETLQIEPPSVISVLVFRFPEEIDAKIENRITYMLKTTQQIRIIFHTIDYRDLILLASPLAPHQPVKNFNNFILSFIELMKERFKTHSIKGSSGIIYNSLDKIEKSYKEAITVLDIKERFFEETKNIYSYQDLGIYQFLDVILEKRQKDGYENQSLKKLREYDKAHNSQLLETLEIYLDKDSNINEAAKALHIHVNTLNYRLKRIDEIGEIDLKNPNQKVTLYLDIKIKKLNERGLL